MKELIKQPNGKYCFCESASLLKFNYSEEEIIALYVEQAVEQAKEDMKKAEKPNKLIEKMVNNYIGRVTDDILASMGYDKPYEKLAKYIPTKPLNTSYYGRDCTTYGNCPNCNKCVQDGIGHTDHLCPHCGQQLKWR